MNPTSLKTSFPLHFTQIAGVVKDIKDIEIMGLTEAGVENEILRLCSTQALACCNYMEKPAMYPLSISRDGL